MKALSLLIAFNIIAIPILVYLHMQDECKLVAPFIPDTIPDYCKYINNVWLNIGYANIAMIFLGLFTAGGGGGGGKSSGGSKGPSKPSGGGHGSGH